MYSAHASEYEKYPGTPPPTIPPSAPHESQAIATGVPVNSSSGEYSTYSGNTRPAPPRVPLQILPKTRGPWSTGLCDCFSDPSNCCITFWCPCITFGQIAEIVDKGSSSCGTSGALYALIACVTGCACCLSCFYRTKLRQQFFLHETPCADCLVHCCCEPCALCQEYRELKNQGFELSIGWHGNAEKHTRDTEMEPVGPVGGMSR
ncbi:hypothetical protein ACET3Z_007392 [Daucus carota]